MRRSRPALVACAVLLLSSFRIICDDELSQQQLDMFHDPKGWEFVDVFDKDNGFPMHHQCFAEGQPKPSECHGTLIFHADATWEETIFMHGFTTYRHGDYQLDGNQLTLLDEFSNKDGPYTVQIDIAAKTMQYSANQGGVIIGADFSLIRPHKKTQQKGTNGKAQ